MRDISDAVERYENFGNQLHRKSVDGSMVRHCRTRTRESGDTKQIYIWGVHISDTEFELKVNILQDKGNVDYT